MDRKIRVVIAENNPHVLKRMQRTLKSEERIDLIDTAMTGYEAVTKTITQIPDVLLINTRLETELSGLYACKAICEAAETIQVVMFGSDCPRDIVFKAFQMGAVNLLTQDFSDRDIISAIVSAADEKASVHYSSARLLRKEFKRIMDLQDDLVYILNVLVQISPTEMMILKHFYNGMRSKEISKIMFISNNTMKTHVSHILKKFNLDSMEQVVQALHATEIFSMLSSSGTSRGYDSTAEQRKREE